MSAHGPFSINEMIYFPFHNPCRLQYSRAVTSVASVAWFQFMAQHIGRGE